MARFDVSYYTLENNLWEATIIVAFYFYAQKQFPEVNALALVC